MCKYCDSASNECEIFFDPLTHEYFLDIQTSEWDTYNDDWIYQKEYISYCPWCGRDLESEVDFLKDRTPVFRFTTKHSLDELNNLDKHLRQKYPNLIVLPQDFDVDWMTREDLEKWVKLMREHLEKQTKSECKRNGIRDDCNLLTKYQCEDEQI